MSDSEKQKLINDTPVVVYAITAEEDEGCYYGDNKLLKYFNSMVVNFKNGFSLKMALMLLGLAFVGTANRVSFKIMTNATNLAIAADGSVCSKYQTFISQVTNFIYIPVFWPIVWYFMCATNRITPEMRAFPIWKYIVMGILDSLAGILMVFGGSGTSGPLQQLLIQGAIPFTMLFSAMMSFGFIIRWLGKTLTVRYRWTHLVGAGLIVAGIVTALVPQFLPKKDGTSEDKNKVAFVILFFLAVIPTAISNVFKEVAFKGTDLDIFLVNAWVATFQFLFGFVLLPATVVVEQDPKQALLNMPFDFWHGIQCFFGHGPDGAECVRRLVMVHILAYLLINIFYNLLVLAILKYGSASLLQISSALLLPMANLTFTFKKIMNEFPDLPPSVFPPNAPNHVPPPIPPPGSAPVAPAPVACPSPPAKDLPGPAWTPSVYNNYSSKLSPYDIAGLCIILVGLGFYRALSESPEEEEEGYTQIKTIADTEQNYA